MTTDEEVLVIQRVSDDAVLCIAMQEEDGESSETRCFHPSDVPDEYGYVVIWEADLQAQGYTDVTSQNKILPVIVANCVQEIYQVGQLRFLKLPPGSIEPPTPIRPRYLQ